MAWRSRPQQTRQHVRDPHRPVARVWFPGAVPGPEEGCGGPAQEKKEGGSPVKAGSAPRGPHERDILHNHVEAPFLLANAEEKRPAACSHAAGRALLGAVWIDASRLT